METKPATTKNKMQEYTLTSASSIMGLSNELAKFIKDRKLCMNIQGKEYVLIEAWTFAGMSMGLCPVVTELVNESTESEIKYRAVVELLNVHTNTVVGRGFAVCSNKEQGKKFFQEYAIASMAQTRATGKAYRLPLGFLMKAAGYEATPAEEMDFQSNEVNTIATVVEQPQQKAIPTPEVDNATTVTKYATAKQKEEIIRLLNNPVITNDEKTRMILNINKISEEKAAEVITKLGKTIQDREEQATAA